MNQLLMRAFDNEAEHYDETTEYLLLDYTSTLLTAIERIAFSPEDEFNVLDVGCGTGNLLSLVRAKYPKAHLYGIDFSFDMLEQAKNKRIHDVQYLNIDLFEIEESPLPLFDVAIVSFVFHNFTSLEEHSRAISVINRMLAVNGRLIIADLIDPISPYKKRSIRAKLIEKMREHCLNDEDIQKWLGILAIEDSPLPIEKTVSILRDIGFEKITTKVHANGANAVFTAQKAPNTIDIKAELLHYGAQPNDCAKELYSAQNPHNYGKTGNNGIFISVGGLNTLVSIKHQINEKSPYRLNKIQSGCFSLTKYNVPVNVEIKPIVFPTWALSPIIVNGEKTNFSDFFVYEGTGFVHLGYNACSFNEKQKCRFCSVKRRESYTDKTEQEICAALDAVLPTIPDDIHFCLGGGAYFPLSDNVAFFSSIIKTIRRNGKKNPIWVEMIPPSYADIQKLIDAGATSFGFNIEVWNNEKRKYYCPGKSEFEIDHYVSACQYVIEKLGKHSVGSCIIVGLDDYSSIKESIDVLLSYGILPCILLLKDFGTDLGEYSVPCQIQRDYIRLSVYVAEEAEKKQLMFSEFEGCLKCNCCTIMHDIQTEIIKENNYENCNS